jgi:hypothetical protein
MNSEKEQLLATALAGWDFNKDRGYRDKNGEYKSASEFTLKELLNNKDFLNHNNIKPGSDKLTFLLDHMKEGNNICSDWKILSQRSDVVSGFSGVSVQTGKNQVLMSFDGTDFSHTGDVRADLTLVTTTQTGQQRDCELFVKEFMSDPKFKDLNVGFVGHSLGGSLAIHAGLTAVEINGNRITSVTNFDGPGNSVEYLRDYQDSFDKLKKLNVPLKHFQWSSVGAILTTHSTFEFVTVDMDSPPSDSSLLDLKSRHCDIYSNAMFDGDKMKRGGTMGIGPMLMKLMTVKFDLMISSDVISIVDLFFSVNSMSEKERIKHDFLIIAALFLVPGLGPIMIKSILVLVVVMLIPDIFNTILWSINNPAQAAENAIEAVIFLFNGAVKLLKLADSVVQDVRSAIISAVNDLIKNMLNLITVAYHAAINNSRVIVDTNLLRNYAIQVQKIMNRIDEIEERLNRIYKATYSPEFNIFESRNRSLVTNVGLFTGIDDYKTRFRLTRRYLLDTAQEFENVEKMLVKNMGVA